MASSEPPWHLEIKRLLCDHEWEHIGWAIDKHDGHCTVSRCQKCGKRQQRSIGEPAGGGIAIGVPRFTVELMAMESPGPQTATETALAAPVGLRSTR